MSTNAFDDTASTKVPQKGAACMQRNFPVTGRYYTLREVEAILRFEDLTREPSQGRHLSPHDRSPLCRPYLA